MWWPSACDRDHKVLEYGKDGRKERENWWTCNDTSGQMVDILIAAKVNGFLMGHVNPCRHLWLIDQVYLSLVKAVALAHMRTAGPKECEVVGLTRELCVSIAR